MITLVDVVDGTFWARNITFSVAGPHAAGVTAVNFRSKRAGHRQSCRLSHCYVRGNAVTALRLDAPEADVLLDHCLIVGRDQPLLDAAAETGLVPTAVRIASSTLIGGGAAVRLRASEPLTEAPALTWRSLDSLIARPQLPGRGVMVQLENVVAQRAWRWEAMNCLYAGWPTLLATPTERIVKPEDWHAAWNTTEGDVVAVSAWPTSAAATLAAVPASDFRVDGTPVAYAAISVPGALGCDVGSLPPEKPEWDGLVGPPTAAPSPSFRSKWRPQ